MLNITHLITFYLGVSNSNCRLLSILVSSAVGEAKHSFDLKTDLSPEDFEANI